jgi:hypothetical protein
MPFGFSSRAELVRLSKADPPPLAANRPMVAQRSDPRWWSCRELPAVATKHSLNKCSKNANVAPRTELNAAIKPLYVYAAKNARITSVKIPYNCPQGLAGF